MWSKRRILERICRIITTELPGYSITNSRSHSHPNSQYTMNETTRCCSERERKWETHANNRQRDWGEEPWTNYDITECRNILWTQFIVTVRQNWIGYNKHLRRALRSTTVAWEREKERPGGQGLGCPWGVVTPTKKNISIPFQLVQKRAWHALWIIEPHSEMSVQRDFARIFDTIKKGGGDFCKTSLIKSVIIAKSDIIFLIN